MPPCQILLSLLILAPVWCEVPQTVLYGLFGQENSIEERVLQWLMDEPDEMRGFRCNVNSLPTANIFNMCYQLCQTLNTGLDLLFTPEMPEPVEEIVQSYMSHFSVPYLTSASRVANPNTFNMLPPLEDAVIDLMRHFSWSTVRILYENAVDLEMLRKRVNTNLENKLSVQMKQVRSRASLDGIFSSFKQNNENRFLLLASTQTTLAILRVAEEKQMLSQKYHYMIADLRFPCKKLYFSFTGQVNISCFQLIDPDDSHIKGAIADMGIDPMPEKLYLKDHLKYDNTTSVLRLGLALDAMRVAQKVNQLSRIDLERWLPEKRPVNSDCMNMFVPVNRGNELKRQLTKVKMNGVSGNVQFGENGVRQNYTIEVIKISRIANKVVMGTWSDQSGLKLLQNEKTLEKLDLLSEKSVQIVTILAKPFTMLKANISAANAKTIDDFEGFCIDMLREIARQTNMTFDLHLVRDGNYGAQMSNGSWNGMIGELIDGTADLALAPLTITSERQKVVDFTKPYMDVGVSIMMKQEESQTSSFSFLRPLEKDIWMCIIFSYISVSVVLFIVSRISIVSWMEFEQREKAEIEFEYSLSNCFFLMLGAVLQRGEDICNKSSPFSSRLVGGGWWFFTLIIISSYTANLAAFLTTDRMKTPVAGAEDLASQTAIQYGTLEAGSTKAFFKNSQIGMYQRMYTFMDDKKTFKKNTEEGVEQVRESNGDYAFLLESTMNEYYNQQKPCNTMRVGPNLNTKNYGIATPQGSPLLENVTVAILELMEKGFISEYKNYWWYMRGQCEVHSKTPDINANSLKMGNVMGIFYMLVAGMILGFTVCIVEFVVVSLRQAKLLNASPFEILKRNFCYCLRSMFATSVQVNGERVETSSPDSGDLWHRTGRRLSKSSQPPSHSAAMTKLSGGSAGSSSHEDEIYFDAARQFSAPPRLSPVENREYYQQQPAVLAPNRTPILSSQYQRSTSFAGYSRELLRPFGESVTPHQTPV